MRQNHVELAEIDATILAGVSFKIGDLPIVGDLWREALIPLVGIFCPCFGAWMIEDHNARGRDRHDLLKLYDPFSTLFSSYRTAIIVVRICRNLVDVS